MDQIQLGLPRSMSLRDVLPWLADPLVGRHDKMGRMKARVRLSYGWHMLNQARIALVEAEACTIFYEECQNNHTEALYRSQYYLDDAALRLHSSCEHMLRSVDFHWTLKVPEKGTLTKELRDSLLVRILKAAKQSKDRQVRVDVGKLLVRLRSSKEWKACMKHRNDWVHNRLPAIAGLFPDIVFKTFDYEKELPSELLKYVGLKKGVAVSVGVGSDIGVLRGIVRGAYGDLFRAYEGFAKQLAENSKTITK